MPILMTQEALITDKTNAGKASVAGQSAPADLTPEEYDARFLKSMRIAPEPVKQSPTLTSAQIDAIVDENGARAKHKTIEETFATRAQGFWAGSGMGLLYGAMMGALVALSAAVAGASIGGLFLPAMIGAYALAGMLTGAAVMTAVAAPAGAATGNAKEAERKRLRTDPGEALKAAQKDRDATQEAPQKETLLHRILPFNEGSKEVFSLRNALIFGGFALAAGALFLALGGAPLLAGLAGGIGTQIPAIAAVALTGAGTAHAALSSAGICMALTTCALFGASFGFDGPTVAANATQFVSDIFSGKKLGFGKEKSAQAHIAPVPATAPLATTITPEDAALLNERLCAGKKNFTRDLTTQQMQSASASVTTGV